MLHRTLGGHFSAFFECAYANKDLNKVAELWKGSFPLEKPVISAIGRKIGGF